MKCHGHQFFKKTGKVGFFPRKFMCTLILYLCMTSVISKDRSVAKLDFLIPKEDSFPCIIQ